MNAKIAHELVRRLSNHVEQVIAELRATVVVGMSECEIDPKENADYVEERVRVAALDEPILVSGFAAALSVFDFRRLVDEIRHRLGENKMTFADEFALHVACEAVGLSTQVLAFAEVTAGFGPLKLTFTGDARRFEQGLRYLISAGSMPFEGQGVSFDGLRVQDVAYGRPEGDLDGLRTMMVTGSIAGTVSLAVETLEYGAAVATALSHARIEVRNAPGTMGAARCPLLNVKVFNPRIG
jgi:hypothetical protein